MKGIAWGRGLFRVWIALSISWIAIIVLLIGDDVLNPRDPGHVIYHDGKEVRVFEPYSRESYNLAQEKVAGNLVEYEVSKFPGSKFYVPSFGKKPRALSAEQSNVSAASSNREDHVALMREALKRAEKRRSDALRRKRIDAIQNLGQVGLIPPIILLLIGLVVRWVLCGFKAP